MILSGHRFDFILLLALCALIYYTIKKAEGGKVPKIRLLPCMEALDEVVGRAAEMGKPIHYSTGGGGMTTSVASMTLAALVIMGEVARLCGKHGVTMRYTCTKGYMVPIAQDLIKSGYTLGGSPELYNDNFVFYSGEDTYAYIASMMGYVMRERPAANLMFGAIYLETQQSLAVSARIGAMTLGGTPRFYYQPHLVLVCDYSLIGEELYAASAYISGDPAATGGIQAQDWSKLIFLVLTSIGLIALNMGSNVMSALFGW